MDEIQLATAYTQSAVECLTLWMESDRVGAAMHIARLKYGPDGPDPDCIMVGLLNLGHALLLELAKERGATTAEDAAKKARVILQDLALRLPE
jgi:hypothetical protein